MSRRYRQPPLVEAVCEFRFQADQPWDWTIPGLIWEQIRSEFPRKQAHTPFGPEPDLSNLPPEVRQGVTELRQGVTRMQFLAEAGTPIVQVGPDLLSVNALRPYPSWEEFRPLILHQLDVYRVVASPRALQRIGLRYINRIEVTGTELDLRDFFQSGPAVPPDPRGTLGGFLSVAELAIEGQDIGLRFTFGSTKPERPEVSTFTLDLDASASENAAPTFDAVTAWLDRAHDIVERAFDSTFTDATHRDIFGEISD